MAMRLFDHAVRPLSIPHVGKVRALSSLELASTQGRGPGDEVEREGHHRRRRFGGGGDTSEQLSL